MNREKSTYSEAEINVVFISHEDIIQTSGKIPSNRENSSEKVDNGSWDFD